MEGSSGSDLDGSHGFNGEKGSKDMLRRNIYEQVWQQI